MHSQLLRAFRDRVAFCQPVRISGSGCYRLGVEVDQLAAFKADVVRTGNRPDLAGVARALAKNRSVRALAAVRACKALSQKERAGRVALPLAKLLVRGATHDAGMELSWRTSVGAGLALTHGYGTVINPEAKIGNNVTIFHGVTIGQRDRISSSGSRESSGAPVIEDEVWIGPNAVVVGPVRIGRGARIAAGAFITEDVPPYSLVLGNPATIVKTDVPPDVANPAPVAGFTG